MDAAQDESTKINKKTTQDKYFPLVMTEERTSLAREVIAIAHSTYDERLPPPIGSLHCWLLSARFRSGDYSLTPLSEAEASQLKCIALNCRSF